MSRRRARCSSSSASSQQPEVLLVEPVPRVRPLAVHQRVPDEELAGQRRVDRAVVDRPVGDERYAVQRDPLEGHHRGPLLRPVRLGVGPLHQVPAEPLGPLRLDRGVLPRPQPAGLDELAGHQELRVLPVQPAAGEDRELRAAGAEVLPRPALALVPSLSRSFSRSSSSPMWDSRPGQQRLVDAVRVVRRTRVLRSLVGAGASGRAAVRVGTGGIDNAHLLAHLAQLRLEVLPLAHPQVVEELPLAHPPERAGAQLALLLLEVAPQVQPGQEVRALGLEPGVLLVGLRLELGRPLPRVLQRQRRRDHDHVAHAAEPLRLQDHPPQPRVDRQPRQPLCRAIAGRRRG